MFKFKPQQWVHVKLLDCNGRIDRCFLDGGPQPIYSITFITNGEPKIREFYEDEIEELNK